MANVAPALVNLLIQELASEPLLVIIKFRENFEWLSNNLTTIRDFLRHTDLRRRDKASLRELLLDVEDIAWDAEDILEECSVQSEGNNNESPQSSCVCAFSCSQIISHQIMAHRIKNLKDRMMPIMEKVTLLIDALDRIPSDLPSTSESRNEEGTGSSLRESHSLTEVTEKKVEEFLHLLFNREVSAIVVFGFGGIGKTFLVQLVFNRVKNRFDNSIWLTVSQAYSVQKLQAALARKLDLKEIVEGRMDEVQAAKLIHDHLASKSSLIVLDDVWRVAEEDNLISALGLPTGNDSQCKIVITTQIREVCVNTNAEVYKLQPLSEDESWNLFCAFALPDCNQNQPLNGLKQTALEILGVCQGLPLAAKIVAASLKGKTLADWQNRLNQLRLESHTEDSIMQILLLTYFSLPSDLKPCFAFLSFFHEDVKIDPQYLINLWIAEELIPQGEDQQDIGWDYIHRLQNLCLLEVIDDFHVQQNHWFQLHDLLLDLAISISRQSKCAFSVEDAFREGPKDKWRTLNSFMLDFAIAVSRVTLCPLCPLEVLREVFKKGLTEQTRNRYRNCRRILLAGKGIDDGILAESSVGSTGSVKTLSLCDNNISSIPEQFFASMKVLRILDLSSTHISTLPGSVANMKLLRVLNLSRTEIDQVPDCIRKLARLRFLNISECRKLTRLPAWIGELKDLEHLNVAGCSGELASYMPAGISKLLSLQILISDYLNFSVQENKLLKLEHVGSLTRLQNLCINVNHIEELEAIEDGVLDKLVKMRSLTIANEIPPMEFENPAVLPCLPESIKAMQNIEKLFLSKFAVPNWVCNFQKLRVIEIYGDCSGYPQLERLTSLETLCLLHNHICTALPHTFVESSGFLNLRFLEISDFPLLEEIPAFEDEAMPRLEKLWINSCESVKKVPNGLERLKFLKQIEVRASPVIRELLQESGEYWEKIKAANPSVVIDLL